MLADLCRNHFVDQMVCLAGSPSSFQTFSQPAGLAIGQSAMRQGGSLGWYELWLFAACKQVIGAVAIFREENIIKKFVSQY